jgi:toxin ParE1/3/4
MSDRRLILSRDAEDDLRSILEYTFAFWGKDHQDKYAELLTGRFEHLLAFPGIGQQREDLAPALHSLVVGEHVILYRFEDELVIISRILHVGMNATAHLHE